MDPSRPDPAGVGVGVPRAHHSRSSACLGQLRAHLKYPEDIFSIQAAIFGRYHITQPVGLLQQRQRLEPLADRRRGPAEQHASSYPAVDKQGVVISQTVARMDPLYQVYALPGIDDAAVHADRRLRRGAAANHASTTSSELRRAQPHRRSWSRSRIRATTASSRCTDRHRRATTGPVQADSQDELVPARVAEDHAARPASARRSSSATSSWSRSTGRCCTCARCTSSASSNSYPLLKLRDHRVQEEGRLRDRRSQAALAQVLEPRQADVAGIDQGEHRRPAARSRPRTSTPRRVTALSERTARPLPARTTSSRTTSWPRRTRAHGPSTVDPGSHESRRRPPPRRRRRPSLQLATATEPRRHWYDGVPRRGVEQSGSSSGS